MQCLITSIIKCSKKTKMKVLNKDMRICVVVKYSFKNNNVSYALTGYSCHSLHDSLSLDKCRGQIYKDKIRCLRFIVS